MPMHEMRYLRSNADIPFGRVTSTARKGRKWLERAKPGDQLALTYTATEDMRAASFGWGVVTKVELVDYDTVIERAAENHVGQRPLPAGETAKTALAKVLEAAYGRLASFDEFTMVHFIQANL